ncbi:MAG: PH domain-containing protein [Actinobacteria bacterium]|nr:PH domain-containing protein [Actinomycetota bacterium]
MGPVAVAVAVLVSVLDGPARAVALALLAIGAGVLLVRIGRIEAHVDVGGVRVRNPFRTAELRWNDLARADWVW